MTKFNDLQSVKVANTYFRENTMYKNMLINREYTLEELGL